MNESVELPDHLTHVLRALTRMESERAAGLVIDGVLPALEKMMKALEGGDNPYQGVLRTIQSILQDSVSGTQEVANV